MNIIKRFEQYVTPEPNTGCYLWIGCYKPSGYGGFTYVNNKSMTASRASYLIYIGDIPKGLQVLHTCDVKECVNPDHLFLGSIKDNMLDKVIKGRQARGESNNKSKLSESNVIMIKHRLRRGDHIVTIAKHYGVTCQTIYYIKSGKTWKHLKY